MNYRNDIRNIAIIAHVDHGKTTLVDAMLKQSKIFRDNQQVDELIMDQGVLEREKGITIMAKNTAVAYRGVKINIIDTPGHADFSGEVERVMNMANGCLLLVDAVDGPMPQTRFVLRHAIQKKLKIIVVINKIDRENARIPQVLSMTQDLVLELATDAEQLDFPVIYTSARLGTATADLKQPGESMIPLFECILEQVPPPVIDEGPFQMLISNLDYNSYKGKLAIGRIYRGSIRPHDKVAVLAGDNSSRIYEISEVFTFMGLNRLNVEESSAGDIVALAGIDAVSIGDTVTDPENPQALPRIEIGDPTLKMMFGVNSSPFAGREGKYSTSRQLGERLYRELEVNLSLHVQNTDTPDVFLVSGRGELHLAILIENMRRENYEFDVSKPEVITKELDGKVMEPVEALIIDTREDHIGTLTEILGKRRARLTNMRNDGQGNVRLEFNIPTRGLIGFRSIFLTATRGEGLMNTVLLGYEPWYGDIVSTRNGMLVASEEGVAVTYGLNNAQGRGITFIEPGTPVYEGMIVGMNSRGSDLAVNVTKEKKQTNVRASTADIAVRLTPALKFSLEEALDMISEDELVEVTPKNIRLRKRLLTQDQRFKASHAASR
ncbi:MAG TPA: translational GTPase TypA [Dehalococcoidia bacterium]|nr:translational GTPase TypA [Dehalococcoidia bacterium]